MNRELEARGMRREDNGREGRAGDREGGDGEG